MTEQPAVVTSQPLPDNIPAIGTGVHTLTLPGTGSAFNETRTVTVSANNSTTLVLAPATASGAQASGSGASGSGARVSGSGSPASSGAGASSTGAAANLQVAAGGLAGIGAIMAAFL